MNCYYHPETAAVSFCRACGRPLCAICQRPAEGTVFCQDHVPAGVYGGAPPPFNAAGTNVPPYAAAGGGVPPYGAGGNVPPFEGSAPPPYGAAGTGLPPYGAAGPNPYAAHAVVVHNSPVLAFLLGFIPGVGAIYNGQYIKGLLHALVFGLMVTVVDATAGPGQPLVGILLAAFIFYMPFEAYHTAKKRQLGVEPDEWSSILPRGTFSGRTPIGPIVLIAIGVLYLLNSLNLVDFHQIGRFWPVLLILAGAYMLYSRVSGAHAAPPAANRTGGSAFGGPQSGPPPSDFMETRHE